MSTLHTIVTTKGQIVIPAKIRKRHNIKKGTKIYIEERGDELILRPLTREYFRKMAGILKSNRKLAKSLLDDRREDREREDKGWRKS